MPKIVIREKEQVTAAPLDITENVVFVPVFTKNTSSKVVNKLNLYEKATNFESDFGGNYIVKLGDVNDRSFVLAEQCLNLGLKVLAYGVSASEFASTPVSKTIETTTIDSVKIKPGLSSGISLFYKSSAVSAFYQGTSNINASIASYEASTSFSYSCSIGSEYTTFIPERMAFTTSAGPESATSCEGSISENVLTISASFATAVTITDIEAEICKTVISSSFAVSSNDDGEIIITGKNGNDDVTFDQNNDDIIIDKITYSYTAAPDEVATEAMQKALGTALDLIESKNLYNIKFITAGGYACDTLATKMGNVAAKRGDCLALIDPEKDVKIADVIKNTSSITSGANKYCAVFMPWCAFKLPQDVTGASSRDVEYVLPGSAAYLFAYGRSVQTNANWFAASGLARGSVPNLVAPLEEVTEAQMHILQGDNTDDDTAGPANGVHDFINPIMQIGIYGYRIWGNRVAHIEDDENSFFKFLNVRMLLCDIKKTLYAASLSSTFEPNDDVTWINFKTKCSGTLDRMTSGRGLNWYRWRREQTTQKATIKAILTISPIEAVEYFDLTVFLTDQDVEVAEEE